MSSIERRAAASGFALTDSQRAASAVLGELDGPGRRGGPWVGVRPGRGGAHLRGGGYLRGGAYLTGGAYLWGGVGRGKTWLMDAFVAGRPAERVLRVHFHEFFRELHAGIGRHRGHPGGVAAAVGELLHGCQVVAFDELHLHDVGDAMLLAPLLRELFRRQVLLVATSNYAPEALLGDPMYHHLFEPVIALMRAHLHVLELDGADHRASRAERAAGVPAVDGFGAGTWLTDGTARLWAHGLEVPSGVLSPLPLGTRSVRALGRDGSTVWFGFEELCEGRFSAVDYLELAGRFTTWVLLGVPPLAQASEAARQRFVTLVDVLCDRDRRLVLAGAPPPEQLFAGPGMPADVARTISRLGLLARR